VVENFTRDLESFLPEKTKKIAVAVSGGADSFALLHLTHLWAMKKKIALVALTVDHQLRAESAQEAENVAAWCKKNDIAHETLVWTGPKPKTDIQNKARETRRKLLFEACKKEKITVLLMGHQADDQAETILMRLQRGTGLQGLLGIHAISHEKGITILRPLLSARRAELRAYCKKHKLPFQDDPSNENDRYERARLRKILAQLPDLATGLQTVVRRLETTDHALQHMAMEWYAGNIRQDWFPVDAFHKLPQALQLRVLGHLIAEAPLDGLERLQQVLQHPDFKGHTLAGYWIRPKTRNRQKGLVFSKAPARKTGKRA